MPENTHHNHAVDHSAHVPADGIPESRTIAPPPFELSASTGLASDEQGGMAIQAPLQRSSIHASSDLPDGNVVQRKPTLANSDEDFDDKSKFGDEVMGNNFNRMQEDERSLRGTYGFKMQGTKPKPGSPNLAIPEIRIMVKDRSNKVHQVAARIMDKGGANYLVFKSTGDQKLVEKNEQGNKVPIKGASNHGNYTAVGAYSFFDEQEHTSYSAYKANHEGAYMNNLGVQGDHQKKHHSEQAIYKLLSEQPLLARDALDKALPNNGTYTIMGISLDIWTSRAACHNCGDSADKVLDDDTHFFKKVRAQIDGKVSPTNNTYNFGADYRAMVRFASDFEHDSSNDDDNTESNKDVLHAKPVKAKTFRQKASDNVIDVTVNANMSYDNAPLSSPVSEYASYNSWVNYAGLGKTRAQIRSYLRKNKLTMKPEERFLAAAVAAVKCKELKPNASTKPKLPLTRHNFSYNDMVLTFLQNARDDIGLTYSEILVMCLKHPSVFKYSAADMHQRVKNYEYKRLRNKGNGVQRTNESMTQLDADLSANIQATMRAWLLQGAEKIGDVVKFAGDREMHEAAVQAAQNFLMEAKAVADDVIDNDKEDVDNMEELQLLLAGVKLQVPSQGKQSGKNNEKSKEKSKDDGNNSNDNSNNSNSNSNANDDEVDFDLVRTRISDALIHLENKKKEKKNGKQKSKSNSNNNNGSGSGNNGSSGPDRDHDDSDHDHSDHDKDNGSKEKSNKDSQKSQPPADSNTKLANDTDIDIDIGQESNLFKFGGLVANAMRYDEEFFDNDTFDNDEKEDPDTQHGNNSGNSRNHPEPELENESGMSYIFSSNGPFQKPELNMMFGYQSMMQQFRQAVQNAKIQVEWFKSNPDALEQYAQDYRVAVRATLGRSPISMETARKSFLDVQTVLGAIEVTETHREMAEWMKNKNEKKKQNQNTGGSMGSSNEISMGTK